MSLDIDPIVERAETVEEWRGVQQGDNEDRATIWTTLDALDRLIVAESKVSTIVAQLEDWQRQGFSLVRTYGDLCLTCHTQTSAMQLALGPNLTDPLRAVLS